MQQIQSIIISEVENRFAIELSVSDQQPLYLTLLSTGLFFDPRTNSRIERYYFNIVFADSLRAKTSYEAFANVDNPISVLLFLYKIVIFSSPF